MAGVGEVGGMARPGRMARAVLLATLVVLAGVVAAFASARGVQWSGVDVLVRGSIVVVLAAIALTSTDAGLALLIIAIPLFDAATLGPAAAPFTAAHVLLGATIVGWLARAVRGGRDALPRPEPLLAGLGLLVVAAAVSILGSLAPGTTMFFAFRLLALFLLAVVIVHRASDPLRARRILGLLILVAIGLVGVEAVQYLMPGLGLGRIATQGLESTELLVRPAAFFLDPNFLAGYLSAASLASLALLVRARRIGEAAMWGFAGIITAAGTVLTYSRSGWVGLAVGIVLVLIMAPADRRKRLIIAAVVIALVLAPFMPSSVVDRVASLLNPSAVTSLSTRYLMLVSSAEMLGRYWFTGTGLGAFELAYPAYRLPGALPRILHPHQLPLAIWVQMGLSGLLAELLVVAGVAVAWLRVARRGYPGVSAAVLVAVVALLVQTLFQYYLFFEYLWIFLALLAAFSFPDREMQRA